MPYIGKEHDRYSEEGDDLETLMREPMQLLRPRRFRRNELGKLRARPPEVSGPGLGSGSILELSTDGPPRTQRRPSARGLGAVLSELDEQTGESAVETIKTAQRTCAKQREFYA